VFPRHGAAGLGLVALAARQAGSRQKADEVGRRRAAQGVLPTTGGRESPPASTRPRPLYKGPAPPKKAGPQRRHPTAHPDEGTTSSTLGDQWPLSARRQPPRLPARRSHRPGGMTMADLPASRARPGRRPSPLGHHGLPGWRPKTHRHTYDIKAQRHRRLRGDFSGFPIASNRPRLTRCELFPRQARSRQAGPGTPKCNSFETMQLSAGGLHRLPEGAHRRIRGRGLDAYEGTAGRCRPTQTFRPVCRQPRRGSRTSQYVGAATAPYCSATTACAAWV